MGQPDISVVMSVFNSASTLARTLDSVLSQQDVDLEFIVVNDGSNDGTAAILNEYAAEDYRLRVFHQANAGLTRSLVRGCAEARGEFIARQDAGGDISLPGRLARQYGLLKSNPDVVMNSCGTRFVGPEGEDLYVIIQKYDELQKGLEQLNLKQVRGPSHHGSTMFRRAIYQKVGGYRNVFRVAQDLDLWLRMAEVGRCVAISETLYRASLTRGSISQSLRKDQLETSKTILQCAILRRSGLNEAPALKQFIVGCKRQINRLSTPQSLQDARFNYFIGNLLRQKKPMLARDYYHRALQSWYFYPRAFLGLWRIRGRT